MREQRFKKTEQLLSDVFDGIEEGLVVIDKEYRIVEANRTFADRSNLPFEELLGKNCFECSHHRSRPCYEENEKCPSKHTFETGESSEAIHTHIDAEGNSTFIEVRSFPLRNSSGKVILAIEMTRDITGQRKADAELLHVQKMEAIASLMGGIAHDFNNLLNIIIGYGEIIRSDIPGDSETKKQLDQILMAAYRATHIAGNFLSLSGRQLTGARPVSINYIVNKTKTRLSEILGEGIELRTSLAIGDIAIHADVARIEQVLMNLALNARDAMPEGGIFSVSTELVRLDRDPGMSRGPGQSGESVIVTVSDTGTGMDMKTTGKIFEPYFTTKEMDKGGGLGLFMVYEIIKQHNGVIDVLSQPGKGTTFKIHLPVIKSELAGTGPIPEAKGGTRIILLAEDDSTERKLTKYILEGLGYFIIEAVDGEDALKKFRANKDRIQLVILDVIMPQGSIKPVYDEMLVIRPDIKAIFLSGYTEAILKDSGMIEEGLHFLAKPVPPPKLASMVEKLLDT